MFDPTLPFWQIMLLVFLVAYAFYALVGGYFQAIRRRRTFDITYHLFPLGIFVWGDAIVIGAFWAVVTLGLLVTGDWLLFWLIVNLFWLVRSIGETIYWFNQQFSTLNRNPPESLFGAKWFQGDGIWFVYQTFVQCITIATLVGTLYFATLWVRTI